MARLVLGEKMSAQVIFLKNADFRLDSNLVVKISDFGLSRHVSRYGTYQVVHKDRGIPIRWMPIESLEQQEVGTFLTQRKS